MTPARIEKRVSHHFGEVLTVLLGDMNFVPAPEDRWCLSSLQYIGARDAPDQEAFGEIIQVPGGFQEWQQPAPTCFSGRAVSRLDRVYSSHPGTEQLDRNSQFGLMDKMRHSAD